MNKLEKYGFENPLEKIGITNIYDVESLKSLARSVVIKIKNEIYENNKPILDGFEEKIKLLNEEKEKLTGDELTQCQEIISGLEEKIANIKKPREKWYKELDERYATICNSDNVSVLIYQIIKLNEFYLLISPKKNDELNDAEREYKKVIGDLTASLKSPEDVRKFFIDRSLVYENVDIKSSNLSKYAYNGKGTDKRGFPDYVYAVKPSKKPRQLANVLLNTKERIQVYDIGDFIFGTSFSESNKFSYTSLTYSMLTVLRKESNGNIKTYNGVIYINEPLSEDNGFWSYVVFSDLVMQNAMENNFGYIGYVNKSNGKRTLEFNTVDIDKTIGALSYAQKFGGKFVGMPECKTLPEFYEIMNGKVMEITDIKEPLTPQANGDKGGR